MLIFKTRKYEILGVAKSFCCIRRGQKNRPSSTVREALWLNTHTSLTLPTLIGHVLRGSFKVCSISSLHSESAFFNVRAICLRDMVLLNENTSIHSTPCGMKAIWEIYAQMRNQGSNDELLVMKHIVCPEKCLHTEKMHTVTGHVAHFVFMGR